MINSSKINRALSKINIPNFQNNKKATIAIPLVFNSGFTIQTEQGQFSPLDNVSVDNFSFFEQVFDGKEDVIYSWRNSQFGRDGYEKVDNYINGINETKDIITHKKISINVGDIYYGMRTDGSEELEIGSESSFNEFSAMKYGASITLRFEQQNFGKAELFSLWAFPELYGKTLFYISNIERTFIFNKNDPKKQLALIITFDTLGDKLQKSGRSVQQFSHPSSIGWCYAWPKITRNENGEITNIELDEELLKPDGIKLLNVERFSPAITSSFKAYGYRIGKSENEGKEIGVGKIYPPKKLEDGTYEYRLYEPCELYPSHYVSAKSSMYARTTTPTQNYYWIPTFYPTLEKHADWKEKVKSLADDFTLYQYQGELKITTSNDDVKKTNEKKDAAYYINTHEYKTTNNVKINEIASTRCNQNITYGINWKKSTINFYNANVYQSMKRLPISQNTTIFVGIDSIPFLGNFFNKILGGIPFTAPSINNKFEGKPINGFIDTELYDYYTSLIQKEGELWIPLDPFANGKSNSNKDAFDLNSINTSEAFYLNDKITYKGQTHGTYEIGQYQKWNYVSEDHISLSNINTDGSKFIIRSDITTGSNTDNFEVIDNYNEENDGFVIVGYEMNDFFRGEYRITAYQNYSVDIGLSKPVWNSQFYSNAEWRKSIRDWNTFGVCNYFSTIPMEGQNVELPQQEEFLNSQLDIFDWPSLGWIKAPLKNYYDGGIISNIDLETNYGFECDYSPIGMFAIASKKQETISNQGFQTPKTIDGQVKYKNITEFKQTYKGKKIKLHYKAGKKSNIEPQFNDNSIVWYAQYDKKVDSVVFSNEGKYTEINVDDISDDGTITINKQSRIIYKDNFCGISFRGNKTSGGSVDWNTTNKIGSVYLLLDKVELKLSFNNNQTYFNFKFYWNFQILAQDLKDGVVSYRILDVHSSYFNGSRLQYLFTFDKIIIE